MWSIRAARELLGERLGRRVTLREFGALVGEKQGRAPWPHATVSRWETGRQTPGPSTRAATAQLVGIPMERLVGSAATMAATQHEVQSGTPPAESFSPGMVKWLYGFLDELAQAGVGQRKGRAMAYPNSIPWWSA